MEGIMDKRDPVFRFYPREMRPIRFNKLRLLNGANQSLSSPMLTYDEETWRLQHEMMKNRIYLR